jgi:hypothetical protein
VVRNRLALIEPGLQGEDAAPQGTPIKQANTTPSAGHCADKNALGTCAKGIGSSSYL